MGDENRNAIDSESCNVSKDNLTLLSTIIDNTYKNFQDSMMRAAKSNKGITAFVVSNHVNDSLSSLPRGGLKAIGFITIVCAYEPNGASSSFP